MKNYTFLQKLWTFMSLFMLFGLVANSAVIQLPNTVEDSLQQLMEKHWGTIWQPGDTIMLTSADTYVITGSVDIYQELTLMGDPTLDSKPIIRFKDDGAFRLKEDSISVTLKGFNSFGWDPVDKDTTTDIVNTFLRFDQANWKNWNDILIEDAEIWGFRGGIQLFKDKHAIYKSVTLNNVIIHDLIADLALDLKENIINKVVVTNSTFYNISKGIIGEFDKDSVGYPKEVVIENNTFFNVIGGGALFAVHNFEDGSLDLSFKNNICQQLYDIDNARPFRLNETCGTIVIANNVIDDFESNRTNAGYDYDSLVQSNFSNVTLLNNVLENPKFADDEEGDFSINLKSPAAKASADGGPIGDPRWQPNVPVIVPGAGVHELANDIDIESFIEDTSRWEAGDTIMLVTDGGEYVVTGTIDLYKEITILGDPRLNAKPIIHFDKDGAFRLKEDSINITLKGFKAFGWDPVDKDTSEKIVGTFIRFDQGGWKNWNDVVFEDIEIWGFKGGIQLFKNGGSIYKSVTINNVIMHDLTADLAIDLKKNIINKVVITNSTFYNIPKGILGEFNSDSVGYPKEVLIKNNTIFNCIGGNSLMALHNLSDMALDLKFVNNICHTLYDTANSRPFRIRPNNQAGNIEISNSVFVNFKTNRDTTGKNEVYNLEDVLLLPNVTSANLIYTDPEFKADTLGDFTLPETSALITGGTDGGPIGDPRWVPVIGVEITAVGEQVVGDTVELEAEVTLSGDVDKTVAWSVIEDYNGTTGKATINATSGELILTAVGSVAVIATSNYNTGLTDTLVLTIREQIMVTGFSFSFSTLTGIDTTNEISDNKGKLIVNVTIDPANADNKNYSLSSSDESIATIEDDKVVAVDNGTVYVIATAADNADTKDSVSVVITNQRPVTGIVVSGTDGATTVNVGGTLQMVATLTPSEPDDPTVVWTVDDESIATIDDNGVLTGVAAGTVTVKGKASSLLSDEIEIEVTDGTSIAEASMANISIMPNPASEFITINNGVESEITIYNILGGIEMNRLIGPNATINISSLQAGIYLVNVKIGNEVRSFNMVKK